MKLRCGITPCPNDTYLAGALALGQLALPEVDLSFELDDIETLNRAARDGRFDIVKVSCALFGELYAHYELLEVGAAIADGYGPLVLTRPGLTYDALADARIVAPGAHTTGAALFRRYAPAASALTYRRYDAIMPALARGEYDVGIVIHEARLTYRRYGLSLLADLGAWWKAATGLPVALGCYVMKRSLYARHGRAFEAGVRDSLARASHGDPEIHAYIRQHAQEMSTDVLREYIDLYVNAHTYALGPIGRAAVFALNGLGDLVCT